MTYVLVAVALGVILLMVLALASIWMSGTDELLDGLDDHDDEDAFYDTDNWQRRR